MTMAELVLEHGGWRARVLPGMGGLIAGLEHDDLPVLRSMPQGSRDPLEAACFPMVPWCNRISAGRFEWEGEAISLAPNFAPEPHAIHGHGWQSDWRVVRQGAGHCTLAHDHDGSAPGWRWAYEARQTVALDEGGCTITLALTNRSARPMPAGLGLHPYLRRRAESRVEFRAESVVEVAADLIPTGATLPPGHFADFAAAGGAPLPSTLIDHCYTGWRGTAAVHDDLGSITIEAQGAGHLHLYAPDDPAILCLEPVNHWPNAANVGTMPVCAPGATLTLTLRISVA